MNLLAPDGEAVAISLELDTDVAARDRVLARAMSATWKKKTSQKLRQGRRPSQGLAFVARDRDGMIVGTVRLWDIQAGVDSVGRPIPALLLGPLAVDPEAKSAGIGSALMRHAVDEASRLGHGAILLVGDAPYYVRFGFSAEWTGALALPGPVERDRFLALELAEGRLDGAAGMIVPTGRRKINTVERRYRFAA